MALTAPPAPPAPPAERARATVIGSGAATTVGIGVGLLAARTVGVHPPACPFLAATGVPCPFCGITRLADALAHLRLGDAVTASPAGVALLVGLAVVAAVHLLAVARHRPPPRWLASPVVPIVAVALVAAHWATSIAVGLPT